MWPLPPALQEEVDHAADAELGPWAACRAVGYLDLTSLDGADTDRKIALLCQHALTPAGPVAAVCVLPHFVPLVRQRLDGSGIAAATVVNFPLGEGMPGAVALETANAIGVGAAEIDVVMPWRRWLAGDRAGALAVLRGCRHACADLARMKVILETGAFDSAAALAEAARAALSCGADFLKTSTGLAKSGASLAAAAVLLEVIRESRSPAGLKVSGGIRDARSAAGYLALADSMMGPHWATPATFRFGASALLQDLLSAAGVEFAKD
ncbi:MAG: deoxyribose-phosphate aldolase [Azospirillum sp.]|nr:deoxyribose-phosphate aldolase [Azospirillum sp.]